MSKRIDIERKARQANYPEYAGMDSDQLKGERKSIGLQIMALGQQLNALRLRSDHVKMRLRSLRDGEDENSIGISDHAVLRYLERVKGVDIAAVRKEIRARAQRLKVDASKHDQVVKEGCEFFAISDGQTIATIWTEPK